MKNTPVYRIILLLTKSFAISSILRFASSAFSLSPLMITTLSLDANLGNVIDTPLHSSIILLIISPRLATKWRWNLGSTLTST